MKHQYIVWLLLLSWAPIASGQEKEVAVKLSKDKVTFLAGDEVVTHYHTQGFSKPIFYPVYAPGKIPVTRSYPIKKNVKGESKDHVHHLSMWFCHGDVIPVGMNLKHKVRGVMGVDFWSLHEGHGNIVCTKVKPGPKGKNWASIVTKNEWKTADGRKILDEDRTITMYNLGQACLFVIDIALHATVVPVIFGDTKEGSMAVRVNDQINERHGGTIKNAQGKTGERNCWGRRSEWCDYFGKIDGKEVGIAIFDDPKNISPACWHSRGYGLMGANPFGRQRSRFPGAKGVKEEVRLQKDETLRLRYGVLVHRGNTESGNVAQIYQQFVNLRKK